MQAIAGAAPPPARYDIAGELHTTMSGAMPVAGVQNELVG
jgi:hypothetical protein